MRTIDVAIIGGSLAGAACVRTLVEAGIDAVAIERDPFPREKVCGGFLSPGAVQILDRLNLTRALREAGAVEIRAARVRCDGREIDLSFRRSGLGVSRRTLDAILGDHHAVEHGNVLAVDKQSNGRFQLRMSTGVDWSARVVIDAAGKLSRFGNLKSSPEFGVQFYETESRGDVMDFWLFQDGYGGSVSIEGNRSNFCFLIRREALPRYLGKPDCRVTGPVSYHARRSEFMAIGDAAGMIDPFCGEGMHHALDAGVVAADAVIHGMTRGWDYAGMRRRYEGERSRRWSRKRALAWTARLALRSAGLRQAALKLNLERIVERFWE